MAGVRFITDGNYLYNTGIEYNKVEQGINGNYFNNAYYIGYVNAIGDTYNGIFFCPPKNVRLGQILDIVFRYLQNHPESRNKPAYEIVTKALKEVWPCKSKIDINDLEGVMFNIENFAKKCNLKDKTT